MHSNRRPPSSTRPLKNLLEDPLKILKENIRPSLKKTPMENYKTPIYLYILHRVLTSSAGSANL